MTTTPDPDDVVSIEAETDSRWQRERDGVSSLHDIEAEQGDEEYLDDAFDMDDKAAKEVSAGLDDRGEPEPGLD